MKYKTTTWVKKLSLHEEKEIAFIYIPKNASDSFRAILGKQGFRNRVSFNHVADVVRRSFKFAILRNPLDRYVSAYLEGSKIEFREASLTLDEHWERFVSLVPERGKGVWNEHLFPQYLHLIEQDGTPLRIDRFMFVETLERDWERLSSELGLDPVLAHVRKSPKELKRFLRKRLSFSDGWEVRRKINDFYKEDWELWNQEFWKEQERRQWKTCL
jgi:hypothetical protein